MTTFFDIAEPLVARGLPVIPLRPRSKIAALDNWPELATTDISQIQKWSDEHPEANCGCVFLAKPDGFWAWEVDSPEAIQRCEKETGQKLPKTFRVRSRVGRGHIFFKHTPKSIELGNLQQGYIKNGDWSARVDRQYCVSAGSLHPISGLPYEIISTADICPAPEWLIDWLKSQRVEKPEETPTTKSAGLIPHGSIHGYMLKEAGRLRHVGMTPEEIEPVLLRLVHQNCQPPIDEDKVRLMARSIGKYEVKNDTVLFDGVVAGTSALVQAPSVEIQEPLHFVVPPYPKFPSWVMKGTSLYNGLVKPFCDVNSRYEEFMFMPAMALMLNYLGTKVRIESKDIIPSLYMVLIGRKGKVIKSSSVKDAMRYFNYMGLLDHGGPACRNAEGKTLVFTAGSPEGLGIEAQRVNCRNFTLFYDELSVLTNKAGIDSSTLVPNLLTLYESDKFSNMIKSKKETYSLDPGTYCTSLIACCTDKNFKTLWGKMQGVTSGLNDRFFFLYQPEKFKEVTPPISVSTQKGSIITRQLIDKAVKKGVYSITDSSPLHASVAGDTGIDNRQEIRAEKFALYFAIDLDRDEIDEECIERGLALVEYERKVKKLLRPSEAFTKEAQIQNEIVDALRTAGCRMGDRDLTRVLHPERYGTSLYGQAFKGLIIAGQIKIEGTGVKGDPKTIILLRDHEEDED
jgi:bifunctional DNA primase/polymerase-like protein